MYDIKSKALNKTIAFLIIFLTFLTSCNVVGLDSSPTPTPIHDPDLLDSSWLTGEPCLSPCWYDMEIGITTFEDASLQVRSLSLIDPESISVGENNWYYPTPRDVLPAKGIGLYCRQPEGQVCARLWFVEDVLVDIFLFPNYTVTFPEVVELLGEPDVLSVNPIEPDRCTISLIWSEYQMNITYVEFTDSAKRRLCSEIKENDYKIPYDLTAMSVRIWSKDRLIEAEHWMNRPWQGFIDP